MSLEHKMAPPSRRTTEKLEAVFDAWQFKRLVDKDVPPEDIRQLQKECGKDLTLAVDKFHELEENKSRPSGVRGNGDPDDEEAQSDNRSISTDPDQRLDICERDQYWDASRRRWVLRRTAKTSGQSKRFGRYVLLVRRVYSLKMVYNHTVLVVKGPVLRNALHNIFRGAGGFTLTDRDDAELRTPEFLFWAKPELVLLAERYRSINDHSALFEIRTALKFVEQEWATTITTLRYFLPTSISFEYLWTILPPDCLVVGKDSLGTVSIWRARSHSTVEMKDGSIVFVIESQFLEWNGRMLGVVNHALKIPKFEGTMLIRDLPFVPLRYHPQRETVIRRILQRTTKKLRFCQKRFEIQEHEGLGLCALKDKTTVTRYTFRGRVIIDPKMMNRIEAENIIVPDPHQISKVSRVWVSDLIQEDQEEKIVDELCRDCNEIGAGGPEYDYSYDSDSSSVFEDASEEGEVLKHELTMEQRLLLSGALYGYCLQDNKWGAFAVDRVSDVKWNRDVFKSLVMEPTLKDIIFRLITAHSQGTSEFDDFVKGKGKGLIGLLSGPPGSGKTLTAEAIAETAQMPLYMISSGALGHEADNIYANLSLILELATHWKAVLLLDEADVFLARRTMTDLKRNAIVSVFLRELEYYQGILLLTTNQDEIIDSAFQSRIHFCHRYQTLDIDARRQIWENFMGKTRTSRAIKVDVDQASVEQLARLPLNGRQIKNAISIAIKLAITHEPSIITADSIIKTARSLQSFKYANTGSIAPTDENDATCLESVSTTGSNRSASPRPPRPLRPKPELSLKPPPAIK